MSGAGSGSQLSTEDLTLTCLAPLPLELQLILTRLHSLFEDLIRIEKISWLRSIFEVIDKLAKLHMRYGSPLEPHPPPPRGQHRISNQEKQSKSYNCVSANETKHYSQEQYSRIFLKHLERRPLVADPKSRPNLVSGPILPKLSSPIYFHHHRHCF